MAVPYLDNLNIKKKAPNVERDLFETIADMVDWSENYLPAIFPCYVVETGKRYVFNVSNSVDPVLGKWREDAGGSADLSNYYTKNEIDENIIKPLEEEKVDVNTENIGDMTTLKVDTWTSLVQAINDIYDKQIKTIVYTTKTVDEVTSKILKVTFNDNSTSDIDVTALITGSKIDELSNVDTTDIENGQALVFDEISSKFKPKTFDLEGVLKSAQDYTDEEIAKAQKANAIACDEKPTYDAGTNTVTYKQGGETKTEEDTKSWFYYKNEDNLIIQTRWINGVEFTIDVSSINLEDYVSFDDTTDAYTGEETEDKTKIAKISALDNLKAIIVTELAKKVNIEDIVDNLTSTDTDKPLSANQGKELKDLIDGLEEDKLSIQQDEELKGKIPVVGEDGKLTFQEGSSTAENVSYENENYPLQTNVKKALDAIWAKLDYVKPEITSFTMDPATTEYEVGQEVTEIDFVWTYNKDVTSQSLTDVTLTDENDRSGKWTGSLKTTKTFTLSCGDGENSASATKTISFKNKIYWGSAAIPEEFNSAFILGLSKNQFATSYKGKYNVTVGSGEYAFVCCPASWNMPNICKIGGFGTDLVNVGEFSFTNASGGTSSYKIVRTTQAGLGAIEMLFE